MEHPVVEKWAYSSPGDTEISPSPVLVNGYFRVSCGEQAPRRQEKTLVGLRCDAGTSQGIAVRVRLKVSQVWRTKYCKAALGRAIGTRARDLIRMILASLDVEIRKGNISRDHVHVLVSVPPVPVGFSLSILPAHPLHSRDAVSVASGTA